MLSRRLSIILALAAWPPLAALAQQPAPTPFVVNCYDTARDVVTRDLASACRGKIVSDAEASAIRARRSQAILQGMAAHPRLAPEGTRLASLGSAFFVDEDGRLLTNHHVIAGCVAVVVEPAAAEPLPAKVLAVDVDDDLALLQVAEKPPAVAAFRAQMPTTPGLFVAAVGYPDQGLAPRQPIITAGVLEDPPAGTPWAERMMIKADIEPGNSGSPLFEQHGLVIGVMNAKANTPLIYRKTGTVITDTGFGIPLPQVLAFLKRNGVAYQTGREGAALDTAQLLDHVRPAIARADCWK